MDRLIYTALSGMRRAEYAQSLTANNLANAATVGFQRDAGTFQNRWIDAQDGTRVQASEQIASTEMSGGTVSTTDRALDVAVKSGGLIAVQKPGGGEGYTRRGDLQLSAEGALTTGDGHAVLGGGGPIVVPAADKVEISTDGSVLYHPAGDPTPAMQVLDRIKLVAFDGTAMRKREDGLLARVDGGATPADNGAGVTPGALEGSNVSPVASLVQLIEQSRSFELQAKMVTTAKDLDQSSMALMRLE